MKKVLFLVVLVVLAACSKSDPGWDGSSMVSLRPAAGVKSDDGHLTAKQIVEQTFIMQSYNSEIGEGIIGMGFSPAQRDLVTPKLMLWSFAIINHKGLLVTEFIHAHDVVLRASVNHDIINTDLPYDLGDTIAYVPNAVIKAAANSIKAAYNEKDYDAIHKLFDEAFTFIPISGKEYRELKKQGLN